MPTERRVERMRQVLARRQRDLQVVVDNIHDAHNAAALLRTADGFGLETVNFLYTTQEPPDISKKVSGHTIKWMTLRHFEATRSCVDVLRTEGMRVYATYLDETARDYREIDWAQPSAVVFGNEHSGCSEEVLEAADEHVYIPMVGMAQSFNVSVSAAIILAEAYRQREAAGLYEPSWDAEREALLTAWIARDEERRAAR